MKRIVRTGLGSSVFILLVISVLALLRPFYVRLTDFLESEKEKFVSSLQETTGLSVSYNSMSPSILSAINIKGIEIFDLESGKKLMTIKRTRLSYSLKDLFSDSPVLKRLTLDSVVFDYSEGEADFALEKLGEMISSKKPASKDSAPVDLDGDGLISDEEIKIAAMKKIRPVYELLEDVELELPFELVVKNVSLHYRNSVIDISAVCKNISAHQNPFNKALNIEADGLLSLTHAKITSRGKRLMIADNFRIESVLRSDLEESSASVSLSGVRWADLTLSRLDLLLHYDKGVVTARTMRSVYPFSLYASLDFKNYRLDADFDSQAFAPFDLVKFRRPTSMLAKLSALRLSGPIKLSVQNNDGKFSCKYVTGEKIWIPRNVIGREPFYLGLALNGNGDMVKSAKITAVGDQIQASYTGSFNIKKLQPQGLLSVEKLVLNNGGLISTEVFIDPLKKGFECLSPNVFFGERFLTGVSLSVIPAASSVDFDLEFDDYAHSDWENPGHFEFSGSVMTGKNSYVQASVSVADEFADSLLYLASFFMADSQKLSGLVASAKNLIMSGELYLSCPLSSSKEFSFNAPYFLLADTSQDRRLLSFTADGSNQTIQINRVYLQYGKQTAEASFGLDLADGFNDFSFTGDINYNSTPYRFSGNYAADWLTVAGDYNFEATAEFGHETIGSISFSSLPLVAGDMIFTLSSSSSFMWSKSKGFSFELFDFEVEEPTGRLVSRPHLAFSGRADSYGFVMDTISYSDDASLLEGSGSLMWNFSNSIFESLHVGLDLKSPLTTEALSVSADLTNPEDKGLSGDALKNDFYISALANIDSLPAAHFLASQTDGNSVSAEISVLGTIANPSVSVNISKASLNLLGNDAEFVTMFGLDDSGLILDKFDGNWGLLKLSGGSGNFSLSDFSGKFSALLEGSAVSRDFSAPLVLSIEKNDGASSEKAMAITLSSPSVSGTLFPTEFPFGITAISSEDRIDITTQNGLSAFYLKDGSLAAQADSNFPISFWAAGFLKNNEIELSVGNISADLKKFFSYLDIPFVNFDHGLLTGNVTISGITSDPEITGEIKVDQPVLVIPLVSKYSFTADSVQGKIENGIFHVEKTPVTLGPGAGKVGCTIEFNRWQPSYITVPIEAPSSSPVPVDLSFPYIRCKGNACGSMQLGYGDGILSVEGSITGSNAEITVVTSALQASITNPTLLSLLPTGEEAMFDVAASMHLVFGDKVQVLFSPLLRGIVIPGNSMDLAVDTQNGSFSLVGDVSLRAGEISWLSRNFYLKEGRVLFNENQDLIDPRITVRAETRERDESNNQVTITMSARNQPLSQFTPQFSSSPAKSEAEILTLLGQFVSGDSQNAAGVAVASGDYLMQSMVMRSIENTLRELCNFDIFSIRLNVIQNAVNYSLQRDSSNNKLTFSNFFDNSTVYIGKYFGSAIYADAMLHWTYDDTRDAQGNLVNGLVFQPEFGFEMASPYVNIRLGVAPNLDAIKNDLWMPSTSITLSWKHSF